MTEQPMNRQGSYLSFKEGLIYVLLGLGSSLVLTRWEGLELSTKILSQATILAVTNTTRSSSLTPSFTPPRPQFIFTMAILSGDTSLHETLGKSIENTTAMDTLQAMGATPLLVRLHKFLYQSIDAGGDHPLPGGLWNAHCEVQQTKANAGILHAKVVKVLQQISALIETAYTDKQDAMLPHLTNEPILPIPINTVLWKTNENKTAIENRFGYATYPTGFFQVSCHRNDFPSLELLYAACQEAQVDCRHVYVHRPPLWELQQIMAARIEAHQQAQTPTMDSTGHPVYAPFGRHLAVIHLWNTMLHIMADELIRFAPRGLGCIHAQNYHQAWPAIWGDRAQLPATLFPMVDIPRSELDAVIPTSAAPYVESYLQLFQATNQACEDSYQQLQDFLSKRDETKSL